ncbi:MAG: alcohol dehydrogenase catalytic domain-containing protein [Clostridiales bacterium]|jgi:2-desacetyl-2-hydroxyethyl bacteriochlorophyllide A dehydrogenase|nr:alcohol dehydrogenase catalytic domain-containing protein [Clostridiales bacterium]
MQYPTHSRAIVIERPYHAAFREIQLTEPREGAYLARTAFSAISSGTDMKTYRGMQHPEQCWYPLVPGYETAGVVERAPDGGDLRVGDRVMINECRKFGDVCAAWGGNSEYTVKDSFTADSPFDYMVKIPDNVTEQQAVLAYLACVALKGVKRLAARDGETALVVGAGMVGVSFIQILKILYPALTVVSVEENAFRRSIAEHYADYVFSPEQAVRGLKDLTGGKMADLAAECSGNPAAVGDIHKYLKDGGWGSDDAPARLHLQGDYPDRIIFDHYHRWFVKNVNISMTCALAAGCKEQVLQWISEGKFDTSHLPVEVWGASEAAEAFRYKEEKGGDVFKILFDWSA